MPARPAGASPGGYDALEQDDEDGEKEDEDEDGEEDYEEEE